MSETPEIDLTSHEDLREIVRRTYGQAAQRALSGSRSSCCSDSNATNAIQERFSENEITRDLYSAAEAAEVPEAALLASLGCGNPTALAELREGEIVLDLGSGGGIDVLLSARRVGPTGFAYGLDMTAEMLALAEENRVAAGVTNVAFLRGYIEQIPLPAGSVDVILSNCVINLSADKDAVLREAFRVLKPGGRLAISDVVIEGDLPDAVRRDQQAYVGCIAGALERNDYIARLQGAGFESVHIEPTRRYTLGAQEDCGSCCGSSASADSRILSAFIKATKPAPVAGCCGSDCCKG